MDSAFTSGWHLDILSADLFPTAPQPHSRPQTPEQAPPMLFGGLVPLEEGNPTNQVTDSGERQPAQRPKRKRASPKRTVGKPSQAGATAEVSENSKRRGRPRVNATDETATEVSFPISFASSRPQHDPHMHVSGDGHKYASHNGRTDCERKVSLHR